METNENKEKKAYIAPSMEILEMTCKGCVLNCNSPGYIASNPQNCTDIDGPID